MDVKYLILILPAFLLFLSNATALRTALCYQETANISTSCGGLATGTYNFSYNSNYFNINYSKPVFVNNESNIWRVKHGNPANEYNITIPVECANQTNVALRFYSSWVTLTKKESYPECFNGTGWEMIGVNMTSVTDGESGGGQYGATNIYDGNWGTHSIYVDTFTYWVNNYDVSNGTIYEEAIYWNITIPPVIDIDYCQLLWIKMNGKIISNHNLCIDNETLIHNITHQITLDGNVSTLNDYEIEPCEFGCDNATNTCRASSIGEYSIYGLAIILILIFIGIIVKLYKRY